MRVELMPATSGMCVDGRCSRSYLGTEVGGCSVVMMWFILDDRKIPERAGFNFFTATLFGAKHAATVIAFMRFIDFIMMKGRIYSSAVCIEFALAMFEINTPTRHDPTVWSNLDEDWVREYFHEDARKNKRYAEAHPAAPSGRRLQPPSATLTTNDRPWDSPEWDKSFFLFLQQLSARLQIRERLQDEAHVPQVQRSPSSPNELRKHKMTVGSLGDQRPSSATKRHS